MRKIITFFLLSLLIPNLLFADFDPFASPSIQKQNNLKSARRKTDFIFVNYVEAESLAEHLNILIDKKTKKNFFSVDKKNNIIVLLGDDSFIQNAKRIITKLDIATPQVSIEARIVEISSSLSKEFGVNLNFEQNSQSNTSQNKLNVNLNLPASSTASFGFYSAKLNSNNTHLLDAKLMAIQTEGEGKIISAPKIITSSNKEALIEQGLEYPVLQEIDEDGKSKYILKPLTLVLKVTPCVSHDDKILLKIDISKRDIGVLIENQQSFLSQKAHTELLVYDGETIVIGGIKKETKQDSTSGVPFLSKIPIIGWLFKYKTNKDGFEELIIFITPKIINKG